MFEIISSVDLLVVVTLLVLVIFLYQLYIILSTRKQLKTTRIVLGLYKEIFGTLTEQQVNNVLLTMHSRKHKSTSKENEQ